MMRWLPLLISLTACSDFALDGGGLPPGPEDDETTDPDNSGPDAEDPSVEVEPAWVALGGTMRVTSGIPVVETSELWIEYRDTTNSPYDAEALSDETSPPLPCVARLPVLSFVELAPPSAAVSLAWWALTLDEPDANSCPWAPPGDLHLGVGVLDPALAPALALAELGDAASPLYGLYVRVDGDANPVWVFGVVGTSAQYDGTATPAEAPPLPDGLYTLTTLHLLPY